MNTHDYITTAEAAEILQVSLRQMQRILQDAEKKKQPLGQRWGRDWMVSRAALELFKTLPRKKGWEKGKPRKPDKAKAKKKTRKSSNAK